MQRCEVTRHLMDADFPSTHRVYWGLSGVSATWVNACLGLYKDTAN
jgi:hypothetical protein